MASRPFAGARPPMHRRHATAKPLQTMDLLQNGGRKKPGNGTPSPIALTYSGPVFRTAKPRPAVGALPGRRLRLR